MPKRDSCHERNKCEYNIKSKIGPEGSRRNGIWTFLKGRFCSRNSGIYIYTYISIYNRDNKVTVAPLSPLVRTHFSPLYFLTRCLLLPTSVCQLVRNLKISLSLSLSVPFCYTHCAYTRRRIFSCAAEARRNRSKRNRKNTHVYCSSARRKKLERCRGSRHIETEKRRVARCRNGGLVEPLPFNFSHAMRRAPRHTRHGTCYRETRALLLRLLRDRNNMYTA